LSFSILLSSHDVISLSCSFVALKILSRDLNSLMSCFAVVGPIPGNPSRMNCFCSSCVLRVLDWRIEYSCFGFSYFFAVSIRNLEVSSSSSVKIIGTWKSVAIDRSIPRIAFSWMFIFWFW